MHFSTAGTPYRRTSKPSEFYSEPTPDGYATNRTTKSDVRGSVHRPFNIARSLYSARSSRACAGKGTRRASALPCSLTPYFGVSGRSRVRWTLHHANTVIASIFSLSGPSTKRTRHLRCIKSQAARRASSFDPKDRVTAFLFKRGSK